MTKTLWIKLLAGASLLSLAACFGGDGGGGSNTATPLAVQNQFGSKFSSAFATEANAAAGPVDPQAGDLPAVSLTTDPVNF